MGAARVLIIAGSDSGGGAGVQADIKTVSALGGYAMTAITAITVQNTLGVTGIHAIPTDIVRAQIRVVLDDIGADAIKIGMLGDAATVSAVAAELRACAPSVPTNIPIVLDPVMIAKGGQALLADDAVEALRTVLMPMAAIITPNAPEAERLTGLEVRDLSGQQRAAEALLRAGAAAVLIKGGHIGGPLVRDLLGDASGLTLFESPRIETRSTHGTGCTLASAIATGLAQGLAMPAAVERARDYLMQAIRAAPGLGHGHGPLGHNWTARQDW